MKRLNPSYPAASLTIRAVAVLIAALAMLMVATASAGASSGGVSADGSGGDSSTKTQGKYQRLWDRTSRHNKRWARKTSKCESGRDPKAIGGGGKYRGAFQFLKSTWRHSPKSPGGDPIDYTYRTQAVVAIALKHRDGTGHWPNCG